MNGGSIHVQTRYQFQQVCAGQSGFGGWPIPCHWYICAVVLSVWLVSSVSQPVHHGDMVIHSPVWSMFMPWSAGR